MDKIKKMLGTKLFQNGMWLFILQIFNTVVPLLTLPYITRVLGTSNYGIFSLSLNWVTYFQVIVEYGFGFTGARKVSIEGDDDLQNLYSRIISARLLLLAVSYLGMNVLAYVTHVGVQQFVSMNILFLVIIGIAFQLTWLFQGKQDMKLITIINAVSRLISVILVFMVVKTEAHLYLYCFCYSVTFIFSAILGLALSRKKYGLKVGLCKFKEAIDEIKDGWYLFISQAMSKIFSSVGVTVLGTVAVSSVVGIYSAIYKIPYIMILFFSPVSQALYPHISVKFSESFQKGCQTVKQAAMCIVGLFVIGGFLIILLRDFLISIAFGAAYTEYSNIIIPLVIWMILSITNNFLGIQFLVASGHQKEYSQAFSLSAVVTVLLNVALSFAFGVYGVSCAAAIGEAGLTLLLTHKILKVKSREEENI